MTSTITIRLADNQRNTPDLYQLDNLSTTLTIDFSGMGVDTWEKFVDFETSDGNKTRISLGTDIITLVDLSNTVTVAGVLKVNPLALLPVEGSTVDVAQRGFKTYLFNVQETINSYGYNSENRNDILLPMAENLNQLMEYHKVKILNVDSDLNFAKDEGVYGYVGVHEVRNAPTQQAFVLQVLPLPLESGGVLQIYIGITEPGSNTYRRIYFKESDSFSSWSNPNFSLEELRTWTSEQIENISGLSSDVVADLLNLTTTVNGLSTSINDLLSRTGALETRADESDEAIQNLYINVQGVEALLQQNIDTLAGSVEANQEYTINEVNNMNLNNDKLNTRVGVTETNISTLNTKTQHLPNDGSFNPLSNKGKVLNFQTLTNVSALPLGWSGLIQINAMSSTTVWFGQKISASDTGNNSIWLLTSTANYNDIRIVGFSLDAIFLNYALQKANTAPRTYILRGKLPQPDWQNSITHTLPSEFQNFPVVLSVYYKNANGVWIPATPAEYSVMTGGNGSYLSIQTTVASVVGLDFEVTVMSRSNAQIVNI